MIDPDALLLPVAEADQCGPDLDLSGDGEFHEFFARIEGVLPKTFFSRDEAGRQVAFKPSPEKFSDQYPNLRSLLDRSRDVRLLVIAAKLSVFEQNIHLFSEILRILSIWLDKWWDSVNPNDADARPSIRLETLRTLDDLSTVVIPIQHIPLVVDRRMGRICFRDFMVAKGRVPASDGLSKAELADLQDAVRRADVTGIGQLLTQLATLRAAIVSVEQTYQSRSPGGEGVGLSRLLGLVDEIRNELGQASLVSVEAAPTPVEVSDGTTLADPPGEDGSGFLSPGPKLADGTPFGNDGSHPWGGEEIASRDAAGQQLSRAIAYFEMHEPSSPALLLVRQARQLIGASFAEAIEILAPEAIGQARFSLERDGAAFDLSVSRLARAWSSPTAASDGSTLPHEDVSPASAISRQDAMRALQGVVSFFRKAEPSSPVPIIVEKACEIVGKDFMTLLKNVTKE